MNFNQLERLYNDNAVTMVRHAYVKLTGDITTAYILQVLLDFSGDKVTRENKEWIVGTYETWSNVSLVTVDTFRRRLRQLESMGFVERRIWKFPKNDWTPTLHIHIKRDNIYKAVINLANAESAG